MKSKAKTLSDLALFKRLSRQAAKVRAKKARRKLSGPSWALDRQVQEVAVPRILEGVGRSIRNAEIERMRRVASVYDQKAAENIRARYQALLLRNRDVEANGDIEQAAAK